MSLLRLFSILLAAVVSGARGWGYCKCWSQRQVGLGAGVQSLQGESGAALRLGGRRSFPASSRRLAPIFSCLSLALRNAATRLLRARAPCWDWALSRATSQPRGFGAVNPSGSQCLGLRLGLAISATGIGDPG